MKRFLLKAARVIAMIFISVILITLGQWVAQHQSSAAWEFGVFLMLVGTIHWAFWPKHGE